MRPDALSSSFVPGVRFRIGARLGAVVDSAFWKMRTDDHRRDCGPWCRVDDLLDLFASRLTDLSLAVEACLAYTRGSGNQCCDLGRVLGCTMGAKISKALCEIYYFCALTTA